MEMMKAYVLINTELGQEAAVVEALSEVQGIAGVHSLYGIYDVIAQVEIQSGPHRLVSMVSREAVEELGIEVGVTATARVKSTHVHVDRSDGRGQSAP